MSGLHKIVEMKFGSHLYGTTTPKSDLDFKGVYIPSKREILLSRIPKSIKQNTGNDKSKNTPDDIDVEIYSLHYFIELACKGETVALDMLHAPLGFVDSNGAIVGFYTKEWKFMVDNRQKFYTKNLKAFVGYARRQAAKYGVKGSRLNVMSELLDLFFSVDKDLRLESIWDKLPLGEHSRMVNDDPNGNKQYEVCGRILQSSSKISYNLEIVKRFYEAYGARAKLAAENKGIDWKAISHALRAAYQVRELFEKNTITFPRPEAKLLLMVKQGKLDYITEAEPMLNELIEQVEKLSAKSKLPEKVDKVFWEEFIVNTCMESLKQ